jgi:F0F1-type ATP synthase delta subunit
MAREKTQGTRHLELPLLIFGPVEVHHLQRELEVLEEFLTQAEIRQPGKQPVMPKTSRSLEAIAGNNNFNLLIADDRKQVKVFLEKVAKEAPVVNISFAADPSAAFTAKVVAWFRTNVHPHALIQLGLQPNIAAGCVVRTNNKSFDFSLRNHFHDKRQLLIEALRGKVSA